jgi:hypothetical protein
MRKRVSRAALGIVLFLVAVLPYPPALGQPPTLPPPCKELVFSTEEEFVTQGPVPADGNPILSDGDLLGVATLPSGDVSCILCARNADLLGQTFDVSVDLGLDAVDVIDPEQFLIAFSTELDSPNAGQFTEGDLLVTNGAIIPNQALTHKWQVPYDLALDAVHLVGKLEGIRAFLDAAAKLRRADWLEDLAYLVGLLEEYDIDIWFSTEGTWTPATAAGFLDGDLLSARGGNIVASNGILLPSAVPGGLPSRGVDFGLDAVTADRLGTRTSILFSTELLYEGKLVFTDGDVLRLDNGVVHANEELINCFEPKASFLGLDALYADIQAPAFDVYLPLVMRGYRGG